MIWFTASSALRHLTCPGASFLPQLSEHKVRKQLSASTREKSERGTFVHDWAEKAFRRGDRDWFDHVTPDTKYGKWLRNLPMDHLMDEYEQAEVAGAWNLTQNKHELLGRLGGHRKYPQEILKSDDIYVVGTVDYLGANKIADLKTGAPKNSHWCQIGVLALCAFGAGQEVKQEIIKVTSRNYEIFEDECDTTAVADALADAYERIGPDKVRGSHCYYCRAQCDFRGQAAIPYMRG